MTIDDHSPVRVNPLVQLAVPRTVPIRKFH